MPAIHTGDGSVCFIVEYAGLKVIFAGDTQANTWLIEHTVDADVVIHAAFNPSGVFAPPGKQPAPTMTY